MQTTLEVLASVSPYFSLPANHVAALVYCIELSFTSLTSQLNIAKTLSQYNTGHI